MTDLPTYVLQRTFNAPRELVWKAWTDPSVITHWYGPNVETIIHQLDVTPGGLWLEEMKWGDNSRDQRAEYTDVFPPERLVWLHAVADGDWNIIADPIMPDWPRVLRTSITFDTDGDRTRLKLTQVPHNATDAEIACFEKAIAEMDNGWATGMELQA